MSRTRYQSAAAQLDTRSGADEGFDYRQMENDYRDSNTFTGTVPLVSSGPIISELLPLSPLAQQVARMFVDPIARSVAIRHAEMLDLAAPGMFESVDLGANGPMTIEHYSEDPELEVMLWFPHETESVLVSADCPDHSASGAILGPPASFLVGRWTRRGGHGPLPKHPAVVWAEATTHDD